MLLLVMLLEEYLSKIILNLLFFLSHTDLFKR